MNDTDNVAAPSGSAAAPVDPRVEADRRLILDARSRGRGATVGAYLKLSGPGWLQGAITLGGGSLAGSLYLGVIGGYSMMWLQPLMMVLGIIMLSSIAYVALSTGRRPFRDINRHVNPVLGWGWAIATLLANLVWAMPQFSLGTAALQQNLLPDVLGGEWASRDPDHPGIPTVGEFISVGFLFGVSAVVIWFYDSGGWGIRLFELLLKIMVGIIVLSFFGVVVAMSVRGAGLPWGEILAGFIPNPGMLFEPASAFESHLAATDFGDYWRETILSTQRDRMVTAAATAVGINMTFLLPYSMLKKGWDRHFRGLATFDLSIGLFVPFVLATSCVVIASASQFHGEYDPGLVGEGAPTGVTAQLGGAYQANLEKRIVAEIGPNSWEALSTEQQTDMKHALPVADRRLAAMLIERDAFVLAGSLEGLTGKTISQYVFGIGVLGMAISTIIILMLINGFTVCEMAGQPSRGVLHRLGSFLPGLTGAFGALFLWSGKAKFWLAVPTSVFGMALLPIAYVTFFFMMNNRAILGDSMPRGRKRTVINVAMLVAVGAASIGAGWSIWSKVHWWGVGLVVLFIALAVAVHLRRSAAGRPAE